MPDPTHRYFRVDPAHYSTYTDYVNESRGYPIAGTLRGLPGFPDLVQEPSTGWGLCPIDSWRITDEDEVVIAQAISSGAAEEISEEAYQTELDAIRNPPNPPEPPEPPEPPIPPPVLPPDPPFPPPFP